MPEITDLTAVETAEAIRAGRTTSESVVAAHLERIRRLNERLNALVLVDHRGALAAARDRDASLATSRSPGPLHGVPVTVKDCFATAGLRTTAGSRQFADHVPERDATVVARLRAAGAVVLGKTNLPRLAMDLQTENRLFGLTCNPWDTARTPGGSTGGGAAAVAARMSPMELGSDVGGSIRQPAHFCGLYGLKPTEGRVPTTGYLPAWLPGYKTERCMETPSVLARSPADLRVALEVLAGPDGLDIDVPPVPIAPATARDPADLRLLYADEFGDVPVAAEVRAVLDRAVERLAAAGCVVERADASGFDFADAWRVWAELLAVLTRAWQPPAEKRKLLELRGTDDPFLLHLVRAAETDAAGVFETLGRRDAVVAGLEQYLDGCAGLLCPAACTVAFGHRDWTEGMEVDGTVFPYWQAGTAYTAPFSVSGQPVVVIPAGISAESLPVGLQLVGKRWSEPELLAVAEAVAAVLGPPEAPPDV